MAESKNSELLSLVQIDCAVLAFQEDTEKKQSKTPLGDQKFGQSEKGEWLQAAVLGANDGVVSAASLMMGVLAVKDGVPLRLTAAFSGLVAAACSLAIREFVEIYTNLDKGNTQRNRKGAAATTITVVEEELPTPARALLALVLAFSVGAVLPVIVAGFTVPYENKMIAVCAVASSALIMFGTIEAMLSRSHVLKSCLRVLLVGLIAMAIILVLTKTINSSGMQL